MKIGLVSFAHVHAGSYASVLSQAAGVEVLAADPDHGARPENETGGASMAAELGVDYVDSYDELYAWGPDAVIVCSENSSHRDDVLRAAAEGAQVLCEKPLATSSADAAAMVDACERAGVSLMTAYPIRFAPPVVALAERLTAGEFGQIRAVSGTNNGRVPADRAWFTDPARSGGGALTDHVVHIADLLDALLHGQRAVRVYAATNQILHPDAQVETAGLVSVTYESGVTAVIDCSWSRPPSYPIWGGLTLNLVTDAGLVDVNPFASRVDGFSQTARNALWLDYGANTDALLLEHFVAAVQGGTAPQPDGHVGYRTVKIVEAAYASVRSGQPVDLDWG